ncbi:MAG: L,D-transpeptidase [Ilumatobacteraceae bacterium]
MVVDKQWQRAWFCQDGAVGEVIPITTAANQPDAGTYDVYAEDYQSWSTLTGQPATLDRFVAFTYGKYQGLRIGFHAVPYYADGTKVQPLESVGDLARFGESSGCIRVLPEHAEAIYSSLSLGDQVRVIS